MISEEQQNKLKQKYNPEGSDLRLLQLQLLEIFKVIDSICRRNGIPYWLGSGTLLGAVRHKGFIPWDDDLDIEILRKDRKRFIDACNRELPQHLHIQCHETDPDYYLNILKVRDGTTDVGEKINLGELGQFEVNYIFKGCFVDIFCEEPCVPKLLKLSNFFLSKVLKARYVKKRSQRLCNYIFNCMDLINWAFRIVGILIASNKYLYHGYSSCFGSKRKTSYIFPLTTAHFENMEVLIPANSDSYLKDMYGNYMDLPPEIMRSGHHTNFLESSCQLHLE